MTVRWRTNVSLLIVSAILTLTGALIVAYGVPKVLGDHPVTEQPYFPFLVFSYGVGGVLLYLAKDIRANRRLRLLIGGFAMLPLAAAALLSVYYRYSIGIAAYVPALLVAAFSFWNEEPPFESRGSTVELFPYFAAVVLLLTGPLYLALPFRPPIPFYTPIAYVAPFAGLIGLLAARYRHGTRDDKMARVFMGVTFAFSTALLFSAGQPIMAVVHGPFAVLLLANVWTRYFNLGIPLPEKISEENRIVRQFEQIAKVTAWSVYAFTYIHLYYTPAGINTTLFVLFVLVYALFTIQYDFLPIRFSTYQKYLRESLVNVIVLAIIGHVTGGLQSPYNWFFIFVLVGGTIGTNARHVLSRLWLITIYFAFETLYTYWIGGLSLSIVIDELLLTYFVIALTSIYSFRLSQRRYEVEVSLRRRTEELNETLKAVERAGALAEARGQEIETAKKRDDAIMSALGEGVIALDRHGKTVFMNPAAEGIVGHSAHDLRGTRPQERLRFGQDGAERFDIGPFVETTMKGNAVPLPENVYQTFKDGSRKYLSGTLVPVFNDKQEVIGTVMTFRDITYLREVDQMKTDFLSVSAHQLRTPLSTVRWFLELLNDSKEGKLKKNQKLFAENAYRSLRNMISLVNRLLAVTRLEAGRVPFRPEPVDVKALTDDIIRGFETKLRDRTLEIHVKPDETIPKVNLDAALAREVFINLIENAIRYTPDGGVILISIVRQDDAIRWSVKDTGIGIPKEQQERIFQKFYRADNAVEHTAEGSGLGLYLAKFIVGAWGGRIWFESELGKGATFHVSVPIAGMKAKSGHVSLNA